MINLFTRRDLMLGAHRYARRLREQQVQPYRQALVAGLQEGWLAGRCWRATAVGQKRALRMRAFSSDCCRGSAVAVALSDDAITFYDLV